MKKFILTAVGIGLALTTPAFSQLAAEKIGVDTLIGVPPKTEDFIQEAATGDMFEIQSSKLAMERTDNATKAFAQQMITDHQKTSEKLKGLVTGGKIKAALPTAMTSSRRGTLDQLKGLQGEAFTKQYHSDQMSAHEGAVDLFKRYGEEGDNDELKAWAAKMLPALEHHLQMAQSFNK
ncbi:DUF4142 domain-containing protein [Rhizobium sullae]|uniref:DUF4142 domain-containing protein n=1 Tax=Rhizobium sullae TaxID=50338 RepID=A0ABY5XUS2_RHISU|nr:DUF4142 domain-containing protein [Rhizobium sullae]UWU18281.1 DUF4142 domain-containing protein [Rhizobium sullae]